MLQIISDMESVERDVLSNTAQRYSDQFGDLVGEDKKSLRNRLLGNNMTNKEAGLFTKFKKRFPHVSNEVLRAKILSRTRK